jgi:hypothetical protein
LVEEEDEDLYTESERESKENKNCYSLSNIRK